MNTGNRNKTQRISLGLVLAGATLAALLVATETPAEANGGHGHHRHGHGAVAVRPYHPVHGAFYVPGRIYGPDIVTYRPWYSGRAYYGPHRHYHVSYTFPILVEGNVAYRPFTYCDDHLFVSAPAPLPRLMIGLNLGPHVSVYGEVPLPHAAYGYVDPGY